jgi:hypothetical protein
VKKCSRINSLEEKIAGWWFFAAWKSHHSFDKITVFVAKACQQQGIRVKLTVSMRLKDSRLAGRAANLNKG